jgi:hypothetical protein
VTVRGICAAAAICVLLAAGYPQPGVCAGDDWKKEFDDVCSKTEYSMAMSPAELKQLLERCDKLKLIIDTQDESTRKVFRKRLQLCRDLYDYVLRTKEQEKK